MGRGSGGGVDPACVRSWLTCELWWPERRTVLAAEALIGGGARLQVKSHEGWRDKGGERKLVVVVVVAKQTHSVEDT